MSWQALQERMLAPYSFANILHFNISVHQCCLRFGPIISSLAHLMFFHLSVRVTGMLPNFKPLFFQGVVGVTEAPEGEGRVHPGWVTSSSQGPHWWQRLPNKMPTAHQEQFSEAALIGDYVREQIDCRYILYMTPLQKTRTIPLRPNSWP